MTDTDNHRVQKFDSNGNFITEWGSYGSGDGQFNEIYGLAVDSPQTVYVADHWNHRIEKFALLPPTETVSNPLTPGGPTSGITGTSYTYSTGGSYLTSATPLQYFFDWGDGSNSGWLPVGAISASKIWTSPGTYSVKAQARCSTDTSVVSGWSSGLSVTISAPTETVSTPSVLSGPMSGITGTSYTYSTGGSLSNLGHTIQYFFDWGDGSNSGWLPVGAISASKIWTSPGTYSVKAQARCSTDTSVVSGWSSGLSVTISAPIETVSTLSSPTGPASGSPNTSYTYSTGGSSSSLGHTIQYFFDWGDGSNSG